ncbi:GNAT family N-acetyltransferase [Edaphobacter paludis]|uniref:GNAT family N-acetyltransferase n=1 Tax=Edaphobacter paludis TaxID=3035702 RepID=A0AAU7CUU8_9BACT
MKDVCIRAGEFGDLASVLALERATVEAPHWSEAEYAAAIGGSGDYLRRCLFVADVEGALIGFAVGKVAGNSAELESIAVDLQARRGGVGRALCGVVIDWCKRAGAAAVELEVRASSESAIRLYQGLGFVPVGRRPRYYSGPVDDSVLMRLELP